ncbi:PilZ domain-containing protein [Shewanella sp. SR44-3]|uniref:PilZ domain-containing protein n=1 Tax=Shewanella sp. SR44-3 TaxID=2760936 RepID=UPI0015F83812|nr:PilZ domain-containing protein [Shewanella sp. SR44-3]MBB1269918.1 PilZ domain-containing protein [Shewanella sp. SR44-3]
MSSASSHEIEKRDSIRLDLEAERVLIDWKNSDGTEQQDYAVCMDLARNGLLFDYSYPFDIGALIAVTFNPNTDKQHQVFGQVCRCNTRSAESFYVALQLLN